MGWILRIIAILSQLQNSALVQQIEQCVLTNSTPAAMWQCIVSKLHAASPAPGTPDHAVAEAAKVMAASAKL